MIPLNESYVTLCSYVDQHTNEQRKKWTNNGPVTPYNQVFKVKKPHSDAYIMQKLAEYDDGGFDRVPRWLKNELIARKITFDRRKPTELEMWETVSDAREHRIMHKELTINDYKDKYFSTRHKSLTLID